MDFEAFIGGSWHSFVLILPSVAVSGCTVSKLTDPQQPVGTWGRLTDMKSSHPAEKPHVSLLEVLQICRLKPSASWKPVFRPTVEGLLEEMTANAANTNATFVNVCSFYCEAATDNAVRFQPSTRSSEMHFQQISADGCVSDIAKGARRSSITPNSSVSRCCVEIHLQSVHSMKTNHGCSRHYWLTCLLQRWELVWQLCKHICECVGCFTSQKK